MVKRKETKALPNKELILPFYVVLESFTPECMLHIVLLICTYDFTKAP